MSWKAVIERIRAEKMIPDSVPVGIRSMVSKSMSIEGDGRTIEAIVTTNDIDLDNEVVLPGGADITHIMRNKSVFVDHQYSIHDVIGHVRSLTPFSKIGGVSGWKMRAFMIPGLPLANAVLAMAEAGFGGWSVGFSATDRGKPTPEEIARYSQDGKKPSSVVRKWKWIETSATGMPCNVSCQTLSVERDESKMAMLDKLLTKNKITREAAEAFGLRTKVAAPKVLRCIVRPRG